MKKKAPDERIGRLTKLWCEVLYKEKHGITYPWGGKEAKQMERLLAYLESNVGKFTAEDETERLLRDYLSGPSDKEHDFGWLCAKPQKYFKLYGRSPVTKDESVAVACKWCKGSSMVSHEGWAWKCKCPNGEKAPKGAREAPSEAFADPPELMDWLMNLKDPVKVFKGFRSTGFILKDISPLKYQQVRQYFLDLFGKEMAVKLYNETEKIDITYGKV